MKHKIYILLPMILVLVFTVTVHAKGEQIRVETNISQDLIVNGRKTEHTVFAVPDRVSEYPNVLYNDIIYVPLTYYKANLLNLTVKLENNTIFIDKGEPLAPKLISDGTVISENENKNIFFKKAPFDIVICGEKYNNAEYSCLFFRDIIYLPLTWNVTVEILGWEYSFDGKALILSFDNYCYSDNGESVRTENDDGSVSFKTVYNETYYQNGDVSVYLTTASGRFFPYEKNLKIIHCGVEYRPEGVFGFYMERGPLFEIKDGYIYTVRYTDVDKRDSRPCKVNIQTGEAVYI